MGKSFQRRRRKDLKTVNVSLTHIPSFSAFLSYISPARSLSRTVHSLIICSFLLRAATYSIYMLPKESIPLKNAAIAAAAAAATIQLDVLDIRIASSSS